MIDISKIKKYLRQELSRKRYKHSINVSKMAVELAARYGCDLHKAEIAGLVHDCTREMSEDIQLQYLKKMNCAADNVVINVKELMHAYSAVYVCSELFQVDDAEILAAVKYHTTGKADMSLLEKVIFLADFIEPERSFKGVDELRELAFRDLDLAVLKALNISIEYVISKNRMLHPYTILARNSIIGSMKKRLYNFE
ncbi:MAG: bis(5'-nucleosyl)-tetraphosphatase (symmetrical) YqeK [Bacillota bacterium]